MTETLFLQFYDQTKGGYYDLCNGFSDTYDLCRRHGDFFWTGHEVDISRWYEEETYTGRPLPIQKGTVYISAAYLNHLYQAYVWAREYPEINFVVGGPVAAERCIAEGSWNPLYLTVENLEAFPKNLIITGKSVEDWFGEPNFSGRWKLDLPGDIPNDARIYLSYTLDNICYWRKCVYCNIALHAREAYRKREDFRFEFEDISHGGTKIVRLNTGSMTPRHIRNIIPALPVRNDMEYRMFMRGAKQENDALREAFDTMQGNTPRMTIGYGIEFPSNRMLEFAGKGFSIDEMIEALHICREYHIHANGNVILGWNNLTDDDLLEMERFLQKIPARSMASIQVRWLYAHPYTPIHDTCEGDPIRLGPFYLGFRVRIDREQARLNEEAARMLERYSLKKHFRPEGLVNIWKHLQDEA